MAEKTIIDMFTEFGRQFQLPTFDYEALTETHRKNIEALQKSALALTADGQSVLERQQEILAGVMKDTRELVMEFRPSGSPEEIAKKSAELTQRAFEAMVKNTRDILELVQKSGGEAHSIIMNRMRESIAEARALIEPKES